MTRLRGALSPVTTVTFPSERSATPESAPANVIWLERAVEPQYPLPEGFVPIDNIVADFERDDAGKAAMEEARQYVGEVFYRQQNASLATYRLAKGWSQKRLAEELGTSQSHVARLETGRSDPQISTVRRICSVLGIGIEEFARAFEANGRPR